MKINPSLFIVTGKGGVGKTLFSLALTHALKELGHQALYVTFLSSTLDEDNQNIQGEMHGIPYIKLSLTDCAQGYVERKLKSSMLASWVVKAPFFKSLINMIPGFSYVVFLGKMLSLIQESPRPLTLVLDAPASGHALTMLEATQNFQQIFRTGALFEDTKKMLSKLDDPTFTETIILSIPTVLSWNEAKELRETMKTKSSIEPTMVLNNLLTKVHNLSLDESWPSTLKERFEMEKKLVTDIEKEVAFTIPHKIEKVEKDLIYLISEDIKKWRQS